MMNGKKTLVALAITLISVVCAAFGIDFGQLLVEWGYTPDQIAEAVVTETPGWLNLVIASAGIVLAAIFRVIAKRMVLANKPLDPPAGGGPNVVNGLALMLGAALVLQLLLAGCTGNQYIKPIETIAVPQSLPDAGKEAQKLINEANVLLTATYNVIGDNAANHVWTRAEAQRYQDQANDYADMVDRAQDAVALGNFHEAKGQAEIVSKLLGALHKEVAAQARKAAP